MIEIILKIYIYYTNCKDYKGKKGIFKICMNKLNLRSKLSISSMDIKETN